MIGISLDTILKFIRRRTCTTHTEKEQFGLKLTLKTQDLHRNLRERSSTSEGEHQFRPSHVQATEVSYAIWKSLSRCSESQKDSGPRHPQARDLPCYALYIIDAFEYGNPFSEGTRRREGRGVGPTPSGSSHACRPQQFLYFFPLPHG